jgi:sterol desaturase/sphingolipid hydroxylase (fatty acid hydroxylase superfamily)
VVFNHALILFCWNDGGSVSWAAEQSTLTATALALPLLFLTDDLMYYGWHRTLHWPPLYLLIHKQHHKEHAPSRGANDAVNAHPIEYIVTACFIPTSVWIVSRWLLLSPVHVAAVVLFATGKAALSYANHAAVDVRLALLGFELYASQNHQTHHKRGALGGNYGQLSPVWDHLFGSFCTRQI